MKYLKLSAVFVFLFLLACGGSEEESTEETTDETGETEVVEEEISELEPQTVLDLSNEEFIAKMEERPGILIDVRTPEEVAEGAIEGSINLDWSSGDFEAAIDSMDVGTPVYVYCQAGGRSGMARDMLVENDFLEVYNLAEGYGGWDK